MNVFNGRSWANAFKLLIQKKNLLPQISRKCADFDKSLTFLKPQITQISTNSEKH
jgi:hypothetical protein